MACAARLVVTLCRKAASRPSIARWCCGDQGDPAALESPDLFGPEVNATARGFRQRAHAAK